MKNPEEVTGTPENPTVKEVNLNEDAKSYKHDSKEFERLKRQQEKFKTK